VVYARDHLHPIHPAAIELNGVAIDGNTLARLILATGDDILLAPVVLL